MLAGYVGRYWACGRSAAGGSEVDACSRFNWSPWCRFGGITSLGTNASTWCCEWAKGHTHSYWSWYARPHSISNGDTRRWKWARKGRHFRQSSCSNSVSDVQEAPTAWNNQGLEGQVSIIIAMKKLVQTPAVYGLVVRFGCTWMMNRPWFPFSELLNESNHELIHPGNDSILATCLSWHQFFYLFKVPYLYLSHLRNEGRCVQQ